MVEIYIKYYSLLASFIYRIDTDCKIVVILYQILINYRFPLNSNLYNFIISFNEHGVSVVFYFTTFLESPFTLLLILKKCIPNLFKDMSK